jgi:2'-hydroxyisoflavone reductase
MDDPRRRAAHAGRFNAVDPATELRMGRMLDEIQKGIGSRAEPGRGERRVPAGEQRFRVGRPAGVDPGQGEAAGFHRRSNARAVAAGLTFRPVPTTAADTLAWWNAQDEKRRVLRSGLKAEREAELLAKLRG